MNENINVSLVLSALNKVIASYNDIDDEDGLELKEMYAEDQSDYIAIHEAVNEGCYEHAKKMLRDMDTAARDMVFDLRTLTSEEMAHAYAYFGFYPNCIGYDPTGRTAAAVEIIKLKELMPW